MAMSENTKKVITYLQNIGDTDVTAAEVAEALGLNTKQVDGAFTQSVQRKTMGYREEAEVELADGSHKKVKFLKLNEAGMAFDVDATE